MTSTIPVPPMAPTPPSPSPASATAAAPATKRTWWAALLLGKAEDARWVRPLLIGLLAATAVLYLWGLGESGWANAFYSAAVQAGSESWTAFFYGSSDAANSITVDKTPASLWVMALSVRLFGLSSWSILVPQALMGVATTGLLFATVRRWYGPGAGLLAGAVSALTPVAVLMFRFNNPDALLVLLMVAAAWAMTRALEDGRTKWLLFAGVFLGFGFLTKMLQVLLVVPAFALAYLLFGPPRTGRRIVQLLLAGLAIVVSAGWWIAIVELVPASMRPYIGGSQNNSILELTLGYNGLGRLNGDETGSVGGGGFGGGWGETGWLRMFDTSQGGQISWLLPAALILLVAGLVLTARAARTDRLRAGLVLWGGWLVITGLVFSFMQGIFHAYYTVALAPAVGAVVGIGAALCWRALRGRRAEPAGPASDFAEPAPGAASSVSATGWSVPVAASSAPGAASSTPGAASSAPVAAYEVPVAAYEVPVAPYQPPVAAKGAAGLRAPFAAGMLALAIAVTAWWSYALLARSAEFLPWLRWVVLVGGLVAAVGVLGSSRLPARVAAMIAGVALGATLAGPAAYAVQTASEPHTGSIPSAGPAVSGGFGGGPGGRGGPGGGMRGGFRDGTRGGGFPGPNNGGLPQAGTIPGGGTGTTPDGGTGTTPGGGTGTAPGGGTGTTPGGGTSTAPGGTGTAPGGTGTAPGGTAAAPGGTGTGAAPGGFGGRQGGGGMGGLLDARTVSDEMKALLDANADDYTWVAAAVGSQNASGYQLATGDPVMAIGGFNGSDPSPTLAQFQQYVAEGKIHYFIGGGGFGGGRGGSGGGSNAGSQIAQWVAATYTAQTVDGVTIYDLTQ